MECDDYDLKAMSSDILSEQMSSVVSMLEKSDTDPVIDETFDDDKPTVVDGLKKDNENEQPMDQDESKVLEITEVKAAETAKVKTSLVKVVETTEAKVAETSNAKVEETSMDVTMDDVVEEVDDKSHSEVTDIEKFQNVQIQVIDVPDDDDLFDFLHKDKDKNDGDESYDEAASNEEKTKELRKSELYRYLTANDPHYVPSNEVTPYQSGEESDTSEQSESIVYLSTDDESDLDESVVLDHSTSRCETPVSRCETPVLEDETKEVRRKPGRKQNLSKSKIKKESSPSAQLSMSEKTREKLEKCKVATNKWLKDLELPKNLSLDQPLKFQINDLNQYLTCGLCKGYLYEASTITECMHTFCKNCIVRHCMEVSLHCPVCNILIHPTDPFVHIRLDRMIQDIVYKILPKVAETEFQNMKDFYAAHPEIMEPPPPEIPEPPAEIEESPPPPKPDIMLPPPQLVSILLESEIKSEEDDVELEKRFVRVVSRATIENVCTFLKTKLSLHDDKQVSIYCCGDEVDDHSCTLENVQTRYFAEEDPLVLLQYRITEDAVS